MSSEAIELKRDCDVIRIPQGDRVSIPEGTELRITQELGGTFTVETPYGLMKIDGKDADAIGREVPKEARLDEEFLALPVKEQVWERLKTCYDPEIPANIVDLGLIYECKVTEEVEGKHSVKIEMTLTAQGCGMGTSIAADAKSKIEQLPGVVHCHVDIVWDPPWNPSLMSEEARKKLGISE